MAKRKRFNATREQWTKTWRTARVLANQNRSPSFEDGSMLGHAFTIVTMTRHTPLPTNARHRLAWLRADLDADIPF